jgi:hypothetical protein
MLPCLWPCGRPPIPARPGGNITGLTTSLTAIRAGRRPSDSRWRRCARQQSLFRPSPGGIQSCCLPKPRPKHYKANRSPAPIAAGAPPAATPPRTPFQLNEIASAGPTNSGAAYRIGEDQVSASLRCEISTGLTSLGIASTGAAAPAEVERSRLARGLRPSRCLLTRRTPATFSGYRAAPCRG